MQSHQLKQVHPNMKRMIVARGGKRGKTSGRGGKGQSARAGNKRRPEWRDIIKKLPKLRGRGVNQNKPVNDARFVVNLSTLEAAFSANENVTPAIMVEKGIVLTLSGRTPTVKILGDGEVTKALKVAGCAMSDSAKVKIEKAGGSVTPLPSRVVVKVRPPKAPKTEKEIEEGRKKKEEAKKAEASKKPAKKEKKEKK
jgi:large subunit ribosomal protein L15